MRSEKASSSKRVVHAEKPNAAGFKAASFGRVNAQHGAGDAGAQQGVPSSADGACGATAQGVETGGG